MGRRFQFSLRALLVVMLAITPLLAWLAYNLNLVRERKAFLRQYDAHLFQPNFSADTTVPIKVSWIRRALGDEGLDEVYFDSERDPASPTVMRMRRLFPEAIIELAGGETLPFDSQLRRQQEP
jgi:hypothetical protein